MRNKINVRINFVVQSITSHHPYAYVAVGSVNVGLVDSLQKNGISIKNLEIGIELFFLILNVYILLQIKECNKLKRYFNIGLENKK
jgi:hypothetical protein